MVAAIAAPFVVLSAVAAVWPDTLPLNTAANVAAAIGTAILGLAALLTIVQDQDRRAEERANRRADRAPILVVKVIPRKETRQIRAAGNPQLSAPGTYTARDLVLMNVGPGIAQRVKGRHKLQYVRWQELASKPGPGPEDAPRDSRWIDFQLKVPYLPSGDSVVLVSGDVGEGYEEGFDFMTGHFFEIGCTDLDGHPAKKARGGVVWNHPGFASGFAAEAYEEDHRDVSEWDFTSKEFE